VADELTLGTFAPVVGDVFEVDAGEAGTLKLKLVEAIAAPDPNAPREPFVLTFKGPVEPVLAQQTVPLRHGSLGTLEIFVVPVGRDAEGATYEAVFA
jgi:hypothetical protein